MYPLMMLVTVVILIISFKNLMTGYSIFFRLGRMRGEGLAELSANILRAARVFGFLSATMFIGLCIISLSMIPVWMKVLSLFVIDVYTISTVFGKFHGFWIQNYFAAKQRISEYEEVLIFPDETVR